MHKCWVENIKEKINYAIYGPKPGEKTADKQERLPPSAIGYTHEEVVEDYRIVRSYMGFHVECMFREIEWKWSPGEHGVPLYSYKLPLKWHVRIPQSFHGRDVFSGTNYFGCLDKSSHNRLTFNTTEEARAFIDFHKNGVKVCDA